MDFDGFGGQSQELGNPFAVGKKQKKKGSASKLKNPAIKESAPLIKYGATVLVVGVAAYYLIFATDAPFELTKFQTQRSQIASNLAKLNVVSSQVGISTAKVNYLKKQIEEEQKMLQDANLIRSPLTENYSFFGYFDELVTVHKINVISISVRNGKTQASAAGQQIPQAPKPTQNIAIQQAQQVTDGLSPIDIVITSKFDDSVDMFRALYVRRAIYINDLNMVSLLNGYVQTTFTVTFREESNTNGQAVKTQQTTAGQQPQATGAIQQQKSAGTNTSGATQQKPAGTNTTGTSTTGAGPAAISGGVGSGNAPGNVTVPAPTQGGIAKPATPAQVPNNGTTRIVSPTGTAQPTVPAGGAPGAGINAGQTK